MVLMVFCGAAFFTITGVGVGLDVLMANLGNFNLSPMEITDAPFLNALGLFFINAFRSCDCFALFPGKISREILYNVSPGFITHVVEPISAAETEGE